jgi:quercetin dioxygenase-like cupin family protein
MSAVPKQEEKSAMSLWHATKTSTPIVAGRRAFFEYADLGVANASNSAMQAQIMTAHRGLTEPTGWHYHVCDGQFIHALKGWVDLEFENGERLRLNTGESMFIPGGMRHNETATSDDLQILEVTMPAHMGTVPCDPPAR